MKSKFKIISPIFIIVITYTIYYFPVQKYFAERSFNEYIALQGINEESILRKKVFKDYKQNGYIIDVTYKDDANLRYEYKYFSGENSYEDTFNIGCTIFNKQNVQIEVSEETAKYPSLK